MIIRGQKINDRYEIIRNIGEGGMANVYLALDTILNRKVAVKILRGDLATDEKFVRKFQREASAASNLDHPNIVGIYDVGEDDGNYFIVMEYVEGQTLKSLIKKRGSLTLLEVIDIMTQLTSGIEHAHEKGIIHRDIKPQNVLILDDGLVKIADFGIAQALNSNELTQTNSVMGSVHYLPPEQANGLGSTYKSDIYSLGILMFELLIGKVPFKGENAVEIAIKQMKDPIPSVCDIKEDIPQSVENIVLKSTAKNPKNRYDTVEEMKYDIRTCLDDDKKEEPKLVFEFPEFEKDEEVITRTRSRRNEDIEEQDEIDETFKEEKKSNKAIWITVIILTLLVAVILFFVVIFPNMNAPKTIEIPDVSNMSVKEATDELEKIGLKVSTEDKTDYSDEVKEDYVIKTSPRAGKSIKEGATITLVVSLGKEGFEAENYVGQNYLTVKAILEGKKIVVETDEEEHTKDETEIKENIILKQDVEVGKKLVPGDKITLTIPKFIVNYPDFVNEVYTIEEVEKFCKENGVTLVKKEKESSTDKDGSIIYQSRTAGTKVVSGTTLTITVSKAPTVTPEPEKCAEGQELKNGKCVAITCAANQELKDGKCVDKQTTTTPSTETTNTDKKEETTTGTETNTQPTTGTQG
ncbi:MAG: Stk1 family PASTA domain-containing Ser/Thr kinase [Lactobacillales bacterium]|nr:Stk1 family PASTA domain-containing Ser/Thr kinase [Lactobacillales bacterium]